MNSSYETEAAWQGTFRFRKVAFRKEYPELNVGAYTNTLEEYLHEWFPFQNITGNVCLELHSILLYDTYSSSQDINKLISTYLPLYIELNPGNGSDVSLSVNPRTWALYSTSNTSL